MTGELSSDVDGAPTAAESGGPMHVHRPKPLHGFREISVEIGVIVVGIAIALCAEQLVEMIHWRQSVQEAKEALGQEVTGTLVQGLGRMRALHCVESRLDDISAVVERAASNHRLPQVPDISQPPLWAWVNGAWQSTLSSQTAAHFPREQLNRIASFYYFTDKMAAINDQEVHAWSQLATLVGRGRAFSPAEEAQAREALSTARTLNREMALLGMRVQQQAPQLALPLDKSDLKEAREKPLSDFTICQPRSAEMSTTAGDGIFKSIIPMVDAALKTPHP